MARLSNVGALVTPERTSEESEGRSVDEAGAMATSNNSSETRQRDDPNDIPTSNASDIDAMGQNESREVLQQRNAAIRHAGKQAVIPKPGKLPRRSALGSQVGSGQRKLGASLLANANTYDVPPDDESVSEPPPIARRPAGAAPFSPVMRQQRLQERPQMHQQSPDEKWRKTTQAQCDQQFEQYTIQNVEDIENARRESYAKSSDNDDIEQDDAAEDSEISRELQIGKVLGVNGKSTPRNVDAAEAESLIGAPVDEHLPRNDTSKRKRGRPSKQPQLEGQGLRKRGRPSKSAAGADTMRDDQPVAESSRSRQNHEEIQVRRKRGRPSKSAVVDTEASIFDVPEDDNTRVAPESGRPPRSAAGQVGSTGRDETSPVNTAGRLRSVRSTQARAVESSSRNLHPRADPQTRRRSTRGLPTPQAINENTDQPEENTVERPVILDPIQLDNINNLENDDQAQNVEEQAEENDSDEDEEPADDDEDDNEDNDEHADETEVQGDAPDTDRHRLYGHWPTIRAVMREVARHRASIVRIRDEEFKEILQACRDATNAVRDTPANISANELDEIVTQCRSAIARAGAICRNPNVLENPTAIRKRGWHIFKHLLPTFARLLRAAVKAFERTDVEDFETDQITLPHLAIILELLDSASTIGLDAYHGFKTLSKPIKRDVHERITIPLRGLHTALSARDSALVKGQETQRRNAELAREFAAMEERREHQARRRQCGLRNQEKWKSMNKVRLNLCFNSSNMKKLNHMRSCGMQLVETDAEGRPYLPTRLRDRRGDWTISEIKALETSLKKHVDTPDPLTSMVFEKVIAEECPYRKPKNRNSRVNMEEFGGLRDKNVLEIVVKSNELKNFYIQLSRERRIAVQEWVTLIPRWMDPPRPARDDGTLAEDAIEIA